RRLHSRKESRLEFLADLGCAVDRGGGCVAVGAHVHALEPEVGPNRSGRIGGALFPKRREQNAHLLCSCFFGQETPRTEGTPMLFKCAHPSRSSPFVYLRDRKLFFWEPMAGSPVKRWPGPHGRPRAGILL